MRYEVMTGLNSREALEQALHHFGPQGAGLRLTSQTNLGLVFQGGGGHVAIVAKNGPGAKTTLELETREWDWEVRKFMAHISRLPRWWERWLRRKKPQPPAQPPSFRVLNS